MQKYPYLCAVKTQIIMRKTILFLFCAIMALTMTSCTQRDDVNRKETIDLAVNRNEWQWDEAGGFYFAHFTIPRLTSQVYNYGTVTCSREYLKGYKDAYQYPLPQTQHMQLIDGPNTFLWTQTVDFTYGIGFVDIVVTNSDYYYEQVPEAMDFRLQFIW